MPPVSPEQLFSRLSRGESPAAIALLGTDSYLREMCRNRVIETYVPASSRDWAVARVSARDTDWSEILQRAQTMPMLAPKQVIIVDGTESIEKLGEKSRDEILEVLVRYFQSPAPFTVLLLEAAALDGRQRFYKLLLENALLVTLTIEGESAAALATQMAKAQGVEIDSEAAGLLVDILNSEPGRMRVEIEKVATYAQERGRVSREDVEELVVAARKNTVWQLADMLASRKRDAALAFLDSLLREGEQPAGIIGALAWMYRKLIEARDLSAHISGFQAAKHLHMRTDAAETAVRQAHRFAKNDLLLGLQCLADADSQLKSANANPHALMEFIVVQLTVPTRH